MMTDRPSFERSAGVSRTSIYSARHSRKEFLPDYPLSEIFDEDGLELRLLIARHRILKAFDLATFWSHGKMRGTDNFIVEVGPKQKDLVDHIMTSIVVDGRSAILTLSDLPGHIEGSNATLRQVVRRASRRLLAIQLSSMAQDGQVWFDRQIPGTWNVLPSLMDTYHKNRQVAAGVKKIEATERREGLHGGSRLRVVH